MPDPLTEKQLAKLRREAKDDLFLGMAVGEIDRLTEALKEAREVAAEWRASYSEAKGFPWGTVKCEGCWNPETSAVDGDGYHLYRACADASVIHTHQFVPGKPLDGKAMIVCTGCNEYRPAEGDTP